MITKHKRATKGRQSLPTIMLSAAEAAVERSNSFSPNIQPEAYVFIAISSAP
jgi:hypothetical protein